MDDQINTKTTQTETDEKPRRRRMKKRYKVPLALVCVLVGLVVLAQVLAGPVGRVVAQQQVSKVLGTPFRIDSLRVNLFGGTARVGGVALANPTAEGDAAPADGPPLAGLTALFIDLSIPALIGGRVVVKSIDVDAPTLFIERGRDGKTNLDVLSERIKANVASTKAAPAAEPAKPTPVTIERLRVRNGSVTFIDRSQGDPAYEMRVEGLTVTADHLSTAETIGQPKQPLEIRATLTSGDQKGALVVEALVAALKQPFNADVEVRLEQVNLAHLPLTSGDAGDLRLGSGRVVFTSTATIRDDAIDAHQTVSVRDLQFAHSARDLAALRLFGVPVGVLNVFLKATDGLLYVEFPVGGTLEEPELAFDKALQDTIAAGPKVMLNRVAELGTDFLKAGKDLTGLAARALDDTAKTLLDPKSWRLTGKDTDGLLRLPPIPKIELPKGPKVNLPDLQIPFSGRDSGSDTPGEQGAPTTQRSRSPLRDLLGG